MSKVLHTRIRFRVFLPNLDKPKFEDKLPIDLLSLRGNAVLHILDTATYSSAVTFLDCNEESYGQIVKHIWLALIQMWFTKYTGLASRVRSEQGSVITCVRCEQTKNWNDIELGISDVQGHSSLEITER